MVSVNINGMKVKDIANILATLPADYVISCCGMTDFYINVSNEEKAVIIDTDALD